jgi:hypothetical protein
VLAIIAGRSKLHGWRQRYSANVATFCPENFAALGQNPKGVHRLRNALNRN